MSQPPDLKNLVHTTGRENPRKSTSGARQKNPEHIQMKPQPEPETPAHATVRENPHKSTYRGGEIIVAVIASFILAGILVPSGDPLTVLLYGIALSVVAVLGLRKRKAR
ncbi:MAG: hypothetical protein AB1705_02860 [Verrucomicrobiota bacterium]